MIGTVAGEGDEVGAMDAVSMNGVVTTSAHDRSALDVGASFS